MPRQTTHSEELQEIMGRIPSRVIRWGTTFIFIILVIILLLSCIVKYPEIIEVPITLTTLNPPADLIAKSSGKIEKLFVNDNQHVNKGDPIAILFNLADYNDVFELERLLTKKAEYIDSGLIPDELNVGELQTYLSQFSAAIENYGRYISLNYIPQSRENIAEQIKMQKLQLESQRVQLDLMLHQYELEKESFLRDSLLHRNKVLSTYEYEKSHQAMLQTSMSLINYKISISQLESNINSNESQLIELDLQYRSEINNLTVQLKTARDNLLAQIKSWRNLYVIEAPLSGKVTFTSYWNENQNISTGDRFATIVPDADSGSEEVIGKMIIPSASLGKISTGQAVHVKLNGYPYTEFGILKGELVSISAVPAEGGYAADVRFPGGLVSTYKKRLELIYQMDGTAGIVTRDMRLIERFIAPIKNVILNN